MCCGSWLWRGGDGWHGRRPAARSPVSHPAADRPDRCAGSVARAAEAHDHRHGRAHDRASRRREQRGAGALRASRRRARGARDGHARRRRSERDRHGALRRARHPAHRGTADRASLRRRRAVLHPRGRLRLLVQPGGNAREVGPSGDSRRFRAPHPHAAARRHRDDESRRARAGDSTIRRRRSWRPTRSAPPPIRRSSPSRFATGCVRGRR